MSRVRAVRSVLTSTFCCRLRFDKTHEFCNQLTRIDSRPVQFGDGCEVTETFQHACDSLRFRMQHVQHFVDAGRRAVLGQSFLQQLDVQRQGTERILDFMLQAGRQRTESHVTFHTAKSLFD